jgi:hypothetical protein
MKRLRFSVHRFPPFLTSDGAPPSRQSFGSSGFARFRFAWVGAIGLSFCLSAICATKVAQPGVTPIQAELLTDLNARLVKVGAPVYARVVVDWSSTGCVLRKGAVLEAHVVSVIPYSRSTKLSELDLAFTQAQCTAPKMDYLVLLLAAMAAPPHNSDLGLLSDPVPMSTSGKYGVSSLKTMQLSANSNLKLGLDSSVYDFPALPSMHMGDVSGIRGLKLNVGSVDGNSTVLASKGRDVSLEKHTLLLLVPAEGTYPHSVSETGAEPPTSADTSAASATARAPGITPPVAHPPDLAVDDIDLCDPAQCKVDLPLCDKTPGAKADLRFSVRQLGYAPRPQKAMTDFDHDDALVWLGPGQLLVTFNAHELISRHSLGPAGFTQRVIRAALLDTSTHRITRTIDWELPDNAEYLWPLPDNRLLVHVGSELRLYGEGLKIIQRIALEGPLAFVRITPNGELLVIGQIRERHSPELHSQLRESLQDDPEEDIAVTVLNRDFEIIAKSDARANLVPPTLLNEGQVRLLTLPKRRYRLALLAWGGGSSVLAEFGSSCSPKLSSLAPNLLFLTSCNLHNGLLEYRVLNSSGKLTFRGFSHLDDLGHTAKGVANPATFVVETIRSSAVDLGNPFSFSSIDSEELGVYSASDGKRLFSLSIDSPSSSLNGYALTADGSQLAVLTRDQISIYPVARK